MLRLYFCNKSCFGGGLHEFLFVGVGIFNLYFRIFPRVVSWYVLILCTFWYLSLCSHRECYLYYLSVCIDVFIMIIMLEFWEEWLNN